MRRLDTYNPHLLTVQSCCWFDTKTSKLSNTHICYYSVNRVVEIVWSKLRIWWGESRGLEKCILLLKDSYSWISGWKPICKIWSQLINRNPPIFFSRPSNFSIWLSFENWSKSEICRGESKGLEKCISLPISPIDRKLDEKPICKTWSQSINKNPIITTLQICDFRVLRG